MPIDGGFCIFVCGDTIPWTWFQLIQFAQKKRHLCFWFHSLINLGVKYSIYFFQFCSIFFSSFKLFSKSKISSNSVNDDCRKKKRNPNVIWFYMKWKMMLHSWRCFACASIAIERWSERKKKPYLHKILLFSLIESIINCHNDKWRCVHNGVKVYEVNLELENAVDWLDWRK